MADLEISQLAVPFGILLIGFLAYPSQLLFRHIDPAPLNGRQSLIFNVLVLFTYVGFFRACYVTPGSAKISPKVDNERVESTTSAQQKWCRKCEAPKPPRAHHCKTCGKCIPKMDHHCPWTNNCVSHFTYPHFLRFLFYGIVAMVYLQYFLYIRGALLWEKRNMPSYLGPSFMQLALFLSIFVANSITLTALIILILRTLWGLGTNVTTIESWEIARHEKLVRRAKVLGGFLDGPDGMKVKIERQEFPYDIGIFKNIQQGMGGSANPLLWFWPFAPTPSPESGTRFETNGFEDESKSWPPPDPDRIPRLQRNTETPFTYEQEFSNQERMAAFRERQQADFRRRQDVSAIQRRTPFSERYSQTTNGYVEKDDEEEESTSGESQQGDLSGEEGWRSPDGDRLRDFGVDEDVEFYDG